jgi:hypothetical protein
MILAVTPRINPTLFDKLIADTGDDGACEHAAGRLPHTAARIERFNEAALRSSCCASWTGCSTRSIWTRCRICPHFPRCAVRRSITALAI